MFQNVLGSDGRMHLERQFGNQRIDLTTGETKTVIPRFGGMKYRIIGINHDDLADGLGKAGLTFQGTNSVAYRGISSSSGSNDGGWEKCELRQKMNSGEIWNLMPEGIKSNVNEVKKPSAKGTVKSTVDKLFLLSYYEVYDTGAGAGSAQGFTYEYYAQFHITWNSYAAAGLQHTTYWTRTPYNNYAWQAIQSDGRVIEEDLDTSYGIVPAWCF